MEAKKQNKRKLVVALALLAVIVVASVVTTVVLVLAAQQQAVTSTVRVTYTAREVDGVVSVAYLREDQAAASGADFTAVGSTTFVAGATYDEDNPVAINFPASDITHPEKGIELGGYYYTADVAGTTPHSAGDAAANGALGSKPTEFVIFRYSFTNRSTTNFYTASLTYTDVNDYNASTNPTGSKADSNIILSYWVVPDGSNVFHPETATAPTVDALRDYDGEYPAVDTKVDYVAEPPTAAAAGWTVLRDTTVPANPLDLAGADDEPILNFTVPASTASPLYVYIRVAIADKSIDAEFSGTFNWNLDGLHAS